MSTLKLDSDGDLAIENNTLVLLDNLVAETAQRLKTKFQFFYGESHIEPRGGLPLYEKVFIKNPNLSIIRAMFRETLLNDTAVETINSLSFDHDSLTRTLTVNFEVTLTDGSSLVFEDFILGENR